MIPLNPYILRIKTLFPEWQAESPWTLTKNSHQVIMAKMDTLSRDYRIYNHVAIHNTVKIDSHAIIKGPAIISANCFIGAHAYLRGGIFLDENVSLGPGCEVKTSFIFSYSALAHFNFIGDTILGSQVNLEAGAVIANHFNERKHKAISTWQDGKAYPTGLEKFGALVGDHCKIGANAVLSPGTILPPDTVVGRLQLIDQSDGKS